MTIRRLSFLIGLVLLACLGAFAVGLESVREEALPNKLSDEAYWALITDLSEPNGHFRSDNLLSNEIYLQYVIPDLVKTTKPGRVYIGVGPEQNFTYVAAIRPRMAFIVDIRRGNLQLHLMYKALFEMSANRADFVGRLFSRRQPTGLRPDSPVQDIFDAYLKVEGSETLYRQNLKAIQHHLLNRRHLKLSAEDLRGIETVYSAFYWYGPHIQYWSTGGRGARNAPTYVDLMTAEDGTGRTRSFLASDANFKFVKQLHHNNLIVPVVGNFAGPSALRRVGEYIRDRGGKVSAFYLSNVEQYLSREGTWYTFCGNVSTLPFDESSRFIRSVRNGTYGFGGVGLDSVLGTISDEVKDCSPGSRWP